MLSPLGTKRAELLAKWFADKGLLPSITHVLATHKVRTLQTVQPIAHAAGLDRDVNGDGVPDGADVDKNRGDGVQQIPAFVDECERAARKGGGAVLMLRQIQAAEFDVLTEHILSHRA